MKPLASVTASLLLGASCSLWQQTLAHPAGFGEARHDDFREGHGKITPKMFIFSMVRAPSAFDEMARTKKKI